jgi:hypothetical protein
MGRDALVCKDKNAQKLSNLRLCQLLKQEIEGKN